MGLLSALFGRPRSDNSPELLEAIAWAVERVEPLLSQMGGYPDRYRKPVARALEYAHALLSSVPGPLSFTPESSATDPLAHAILPVQDELHVAMQRSRDIQVFLNDHPDATQVYALMCVRRRSKGMLGMEMEGEILRRDVPQEVVYFTDYTLAEPGLTEEEARQQIAQGFFESLIAHVVTRIEKRKQERIALAQERDELLAQLHTATPSQRQEYELRLKQVLERLGDLVESLALGNYYKDFDEVLQKPEEHLYIEQIEVTLESMGIVRKPGSATGENLVFSDLIGRDRRRWTVAIMYCNQVKNRATITDRLENAQRWLGF